ncbi:MAG: hypothetical protein EB832_03985 [Thaumarchaeota archaeon S14]|nr:MAG: hypothetical protein EB832_03985 [Thaumarchaeota archaeon S14]
MRQACSLAAALRVPRLPRHGACAAAPPAAPPGAPPGLPAAVPRGHGAPTGAERLAAHGAWILPGAPRLVGALPVNYR